MDSEKKSGGGKVYRKRREEKIKKIEEITSQHSKSAEREKKLNQETIATNNMHI